MNYNKTGFTLLELTVVLVILSIMVGLAIPNFVRAKAIVMQQRMKDNLISLYNYEMVFYVEKGVFQPYKESYPYYGFAMIFPYHKEKTRIYPRGAEFDVLNIPRNNRYLYIVYWYKNRRKNKIKFYTIAYASRYYHNDLDGDWESDYWIVQYNLRKRKPFFYAIRNDLAR